MGLFIERPSKKSPELGIVPLLDVVFILLIFVILAANFERFRGVKVQLPRSGLAEKLGVEKRLRLTLDRRGVFFFEGRALPSGELERILSRFRSNYGEIVVRADRDAPLQSAILLLELAKKYRYRDLSFLTEGEKASGERGSREKLPVRKNGKRGR